MPSQDTATTTAGESLSADGGSEAHADRVFASVNSATGQVIG
jgi:hypothetical protein